MAQFLAPIVNNQQEDNNGAPLSGGTIEVYLAGTSTPAGTTSDKAGVVPNTNPITLNTLGVNSQGAVWLTGGASYKYVIKNSVGIVQRTIDNVSGINDTTIATDQWSLYTAVPTYISATSFSVVGDQTQIFQVGRRVKTTNTGGTIYSTITSSVYSAPNTTITVGNDSGVLDAGLSSVSYGIISSINTSAPVVSPIGGFGDRNLLINGNFAINQRGYVSGVATTGANQYTLDRWRIVTSGQNATFASASPDRVVTCPAGGLEQVIEGLMVAGGVYTLSWTGTATAKVNGVAITNGGNTASLPANTNVTIQFASGTVGVAQFEIGTTATPYQRRQLATELALCQRYFLKTFPQGVTPSQFVGSQAGAVFFTYGASGGFRTQWAFPVEMRVPPTLTGYNPGANNSGWLGTIGGATYAASASVGIGTRQTDVGAAASLAGGEIYVIHLTASAEL